MVLSLVRRLTHKALSTSMSSWYIMHAGLPDIRWHDLRHTCATLLLGRGVHPKWVQDLLGHASVSMTLDRYSHWIPSMVRHAAEGMDKALG